MCGLNVAESAVHLAVMKTSLAFPCGIKHLLAMRNVSGLSNLRHG